jgi:hypothetical protein
MCATNINSRENPRVQDLEIYIRDVQPGAVSAWLGAHVDALELNDQDLSGVVKGQARYQGHPLRISLYPGAFGKHYASLVLEGEHLPWRTDLDCARSAWRALETEIRCSPGDWKEGDPVEDETWWRLDSRGEKRVVWN